MSSTGFEPLILRSCCDALINTVRFETSRGEVCRGPGGLIFARPFADLWLASAAGVAEGIIHSRR